MLGNHLLGLYEKALPDNLCWEERLQACKKLGFDYIEISIDEQDSRLERLYWPESKKIELLSAKNNTGMPIRSMCLSAHRRFPFGSADSSIRKKAKEIIKLAVKFADFIGIRVIQLAGYDVYYEKSTNASREAFLDGLLYARDIASKYQVMLGMEIMDTEFINSITKNLWYENQLHSPWYKTYPDIGNLTAWGNDIRQELKSGIDSIVAVHLKDTFAVTDTYHGKFKCVPFGKGCVDFVSLFRTLEQLNYRGPFMIEMWSDKKKDNIAEIKSARDFIIQQYKKAVKK